MCGIEHSNDISVTDFPDLEFQANVSKVNLNCDYDFLCICATLVHIGALPSILVSLNVSACMCRLDIQIDTYYQHITVIKFFRLGHRSKTATQNLSDKLLTSWVDGVQTGGVS